MLVILVNDKRQEIGILRSMGASAGNIASIFGVCGLSMGLVGGVLGTGAAMLTLHYLHPLIDLISFVQGYDAFNSMFYGDTLPNDLSYRALSFVFVTTLVISLLAGIIPAIKAARMRPSAILRSE
jgi:lipoprotein-releasing system permease protein